ncbi:MAG TPA: tetratricopeptide repeat protein [Vicinamibacterales bacterium]|nr:tetratricopeptide repeat protein [Vicinamibacterales bacterium]
MDIASLEQQAIAFARRGDFGAAARQVNQELTELAPGNEGAWTRLARCNIELGLLDEANAALETVLRLNPQNMIARSLLQEAIRRAVALETPEPAPRRRRAPGAGGARAKKVRSSSTPARGFGRAQFAALAQLPSTAAVESLGPAIDALLAALNERPFAARIVDTRNRAGNPGARLFRRDTVQAGGAGHVYVFHYGGRWEPQINIGFFAGEPWGRSAIRAGIGFNLAAADSDPDRAAGQERVLEYFERLQRLVSSSWKGLLTGWMGANGGFIQHGARPPEVDLLPGEAVSWLIDDARAAEREWIFVGRWLFADRPADAAVIEDPGRLAAWLEQTFVDLLPLWTSLYRA